MGTFRNLQLLRILDMSHNLLSQLDCDVFCGMTKLAILNLSFNMLSEMPTLNTASLMQFDCSNNFVTDLPPSKLKSCRNLQKLNLSHNELRSVAAKQPFRGLKSLESLNMSRNRLVRLPSTAFQDLCSLQDVTFRITNLQKIQ